MRTKVDSDANHIDDLQMASSSPAGEFDQLLSDDVAFLDFVVSINDSPTAHNNYKAVRRLKMSSRS